MGFLWNFLDLWILMNDCLHFYWMKSSRIQNKQFWQWRSKKHKPWSFSSLWLTSWRCLKSTKSFLNTFQRSLERAFMKGHFFNTILYASIDDSVAMSVFSEKLFSQTKSPNLSTSICHTTVLLLWCIGNQYSEVSFNLLSTSQCCFGWYLLILMCSL